MGYRYWMLATLVACVPTVASAQTAHDAGLPSVTLHVGLAEAVRTSTERHPQVAIARAGYHRARSGVAIADAASWPNVEAGATLSRTDDERRIGDRVVQSATAGSARVVVNVPLFVPKQTVKLRQAFDAEGIAYAELLASERSVALAAARAWLAVVAQRRNLEVQARALVTAGAHHAIAAARAAGGVGGKLDVLRAEQEVATVTAQLHAARSSLVRAREALGVALGSDGAADVAEGWDSLEPATPVTATQVEIRADVRAAKKRLALAKSAVDDLWAEYAPALSLAGQALFQYPQTATAPLVGWRAEAAASVPIWEAGGRSGMKRSQEHVVAGARAALDQVLQQAAADLRGASAALAEARAALDAARHAANAAGQAMALVETAFRAGATTSLELVDAERRARDAETAVATAEDTVRSLQVEVLFAAGRLP